MSIKIFVLGFTYLLIYLLIRASLISPNGPKQNFQLSGFAMGRAFAEVTYSLVEDVTLDWGCWPLVEVDEVMGHLCANGTIEACSQQATPIW